MCHNSYSLFTSPQCHQIFTFTHVCCCLLRVFDALPTVQKTRSKNAHHVVCKTSHERVPESRTKCCRRRAWRGCRTPPVRRRKCLLECHACDVTRTRSGIMDIMRQQPSSAQHRAHAHEKEGEKGRRGKKFWVHTYPTVSSRPRGWCMQSLVEISSEIWICIRYNHTNKLSALYIRWCILQ
jgi:hypothetical protein